MKCELKLHSKGFYWELWGPWLCFNFSRRFSCFRFSIYSVFVCNFSGPELLVGRRRNFYNVVRVDKRTFYHEQVFSIKWGLSGWTSLALQKQQATKFKTTTEHVHVKMQKKKTFIHWIRWTDVLTVFTFCTLICIFRQWESMEKSV